MRELKIITHRRGGEFLLGLNDASPLNRLPELVQGDTVNLKFVHVDKDESSPAPTLYRITPWPPNMGIRVSALLIDAPPDTGTFKLKVTYAGDSTETTAKIPYTADSSFKSAVLNALLALPGIANDQVSISDPPSTPLHFVYLSFADAANVVGLAVEENGLAPVSIAQTFMMRASPSRQFLLKLTQAPFELSNSFTGTVPVQPIVAEARAGGVGVNEIQTIAFDINSVGALQLTWSGAKTEMLVLPGATVTQVENALNALLPGGADNPSFRVSGLPNGVIAVEFIGPLGGVAHPPLAAEIIATPSATELSGQIVLDDPRFERLLNGAEKADCKLEVVFTSPGGEGTIIRTFSLVNDGTSEQTEDQLAAAGAVITIEKTIYVDADLGEPMILAAPGFVFPLPELGDPYLVNHGLDTWEPTVKVTLYEVNHTTFAAALASDPDDVQGALEAARTGSRDLGPGEFSAKATSENQVRVEIGLPLVDDPTEPLDYRLIRISVGASAGVLQAWAFKVLWSNVVESLPGGQTLAAKLAALEAAIGMVNGELKFAVSNLIGKITAENIDLVSILNAIATAYAAGDTNIQQVINSLLMNAVVNNPTLVGQLFVNASTNTTAITAFTQLVQNIIAAQPGADVGNSHSFFPPFELQAPMPTDLPGLIRLVNVPAEVRETSGSGEDSKEITYAGTAEVQENVRLIRYGLLSPMVETGNVEEDPKSDVRLDPDPAEDGKVYTVSGDNVYANASGGRGQLHFRDGDLVAFANGHWFQVRYAGEGRYYPVECEADILHDIIGYDQLLPGGVYQAPFALSLQNACYARGERISARVTVSWEVLEGFELSDGISTLDWTDPAGHLSVAVPLSDAPDSLRGFIRISVNDEGEATITVQIGPVSETFLFDNTNLAIRLRLRDYDFSGPAGARGALIVRLAENAAYAAITNP